MVVSQQPQRAVACLLHCHESHLSHIRHGRRRPNLHLALALERLTASWEHGPIRVAEWDAPVSAVVARKKKAPRARRRPA